MHPLESRTRSLSRRTPVLERMLLIRERTVFSVTPTIRDLPRCMTITQQQCDAKFGAA
jgi:hypothetical protein